MTERTLARDHRFDRGLERRFGSFDRSNNAARIRADAGFSNRNQDILAALKHYIDGRLKPIEDALGVLKTDVAAIRDATVR